MKGQRRLLQGIALCLLFTGLFLTGCSGNAAGGNKRLRIGVRADIMNFGYLNEKSGKYYGFEIDLANELSEKLGYGAPEFVTVTPDSRKEMLLSGEVDALIACYSISDTRLENFDFSPAYYHDAIRIMAERSSLLETPKDLLGKRIGILRGSNAGPLFAIKMSELGLVTEEPNFSPDTYANGFSYVQADSYEELSQLLEDGRADVAVLDGSIAQTYMNEDRMFLSEEVEPQDYGVATQKGSALSAPMAEAVQALLDDGTVARLIDKWN